MSQAPAPVRVKSGPPWWVWGILALSTVAVVAGLIVSAVPEDPYKLFLEAREILESPRGEKAEADQKIAELRKFSGYDSHITLLEGMRAYAESRDLRALELYAEVPEGHELKALALEKSGAAFRRAGKYDDSMKAYQQAIASGGESSVTARVALAQMYIGVGAFQLAQQTLTEAIEQEADNRTALETRASCLQRQFKFQEALEDYQKFLVTAGDFSAANPGVLSGYAECLIETENTELLKEFADQHLNLLEALGQKLNVQLAAKQFDEVKAAIAAEGPEGQGESPEARMALLKIAVAQENWLEADRLVEGLLLVRPRDKQLFELALELYRSTDKNERAQVAEQNVAALAELDATLKENLKRVSDDIDDAEGRVEVARAYMQLARYEDARVWFSLAATMNSEFAEEARDAIMGKTYPTQPIVAFGPGAGTPAEAKKEDQPEADKAKPAGDDKPAENAKPADDKPAADEKPTEEEPVEEKAAGETPAPTEEKPAAEEKPADAPPADEKPAEDKPVEEKPADETAAPADEPAAEKPAVEEKPADAPPAEEKPASDES